MNGDKIKRPGKKKRKKRRGGPDRRGIPRGRVRNREAFEVNKKSVVGGRRRTSLSNMHPMILHGSSLAWDLL